MPVPVAELLLGLALGLSLAAPPGPMNAWIAAASTAAYRRGVATGFGAVVADGVLASVVYLLSRSADLAAWLRIVYALGAVVMAVFALRLYRGLGKPGAPVVGTRSFLQAFGLGLSNPFQILWWLTSGIGFAYVGGAVLLVGLFAALVAWVLSFPLAIRLGARRDPRVERAILIGSTAAMALFAGYFAFLALGGRAVL